MHPDVGADPDHILRKNINGKAGFARIDVTPPLGTTLAGYYETRYADGILDPLLASAVASDNSENRIIVMGIDFIGFNQKLMNRVRAAVAEAAHTDPKAVVKVYEAEGLDAITPFPGRNKAQIHTIAKRVVAVDKFPDEKELYLTAVSVGDVVFAGFPGEPFTDIGRGIKANSKFTLTIPACCAKGYEGYYPMQSAYDEGGYEARTARYVADTAEKLIAASTEIVNNL